MIEALIAVIVLGILGYFIWPKAKKVVEEEVERDIKKVEDVIVKVETALVAEGKEAAIELVKNIETKVEEVAVKVEEEIKEEVKKVVAKVKKTTEKAKTEVVRNTKKKK